MKEKLLELHKNRYGPISHFPVSASLITKDGKTFYGVNVEDASTRAGTCAERNALFQAISNGYTKGDFKEINVMTSSKRIGTPCFVCRQLISELMDKDSIIRCYNTRGEYKEFTVSELCPFPFEEEDLLWNVDLLVL